MNSSLSTATGAPIFAQPTILFVSVIALLLIFLVAAFVSVVGHGWPYNGKSAKVLSMANCGMGAAVGIGVIP